MKYWEEGDTPTVKDFGVFIVEPGSDQFKRCPEEFTGCSFIGFRTERGDTVMLRPWTWTSGSQYHGKPVGYWSIFCTDEDRIRMRLRIEHLTNKMKEVW